MQAIWRLGFKSTLPPYIRPVISSWWPAWPRADWVGATGLTPAGEGGAIGSLDAVLSEPNEAGSDLAVYYDAPRTFLGSVRVEF